jgi:hypothetical protein
MIKLCCFYYAILLNLPLACAVAVTHLLISLLYLRESRVAHFRVASETQKKPFRLRSSFRFLAFFAALRLGDVLHMRLGGRVVVKFNVWIDPESVWLMLGRL